MSSDFIKEDIKKKPVNKTKVLKKIFFTIGCAVIFGIVASLVILVLEPFFEKKLTNRKTDTNTSVVSFPEDQNEMSPEEMLSEYMQQESELMDVDPDSENTIGDTEGDSQTAEEPVEIPLSDEQIEEILNQVTLSVTNYRQLSTSMAALSKELSKYMVSITSSSSSVDWLDSVNNEKKTTSGVVVASNNVDLLILADSSKIKKSDEIEVSFFTGLTLTGEIRSTDANTGLSIIAVSLSEIPSDMDVSQYIAKLGSSSGLYVGYPVIAVGSPKGTYGSMDYGIVDIPKKSQSMTDGYVSLIQTNISGSSNASGVLFTLQGQVVGIITNNIDSTSGENVICAYGITELKNCIEKMSNGKEINYLGITGTDVTSAANTELGVPLGAYVISTKMDSPAMRAGIQTGDIIVGIDATTIGSYSDYCLILNQKSVNDTVKLKVMRKSQNEYTEMTMEMTIEAFPG